MDIARAREAFPAAANMVCYNHAGIAPLPRASVEAHRAFTEDRAAFGSKNYFAWLEAVARTRELAARLIGASPAEIAFTGNTSMGLSLVAAGLSWRHGDRVLVSAPDFPSVIYPWLNLARHGVTVDYLERVDGRIGLEAAAKALESPAKMLVAASVDFATGAACDLAGLGALCRERDVLFCLDAVQSLGVLPLSIKETGAHFAAAGTHKWLCGPMGLGLLYVAEETADLLHTPVAGWKSVVDEENFSLHFDLKTEAARLEPGTLDVGAIMALRASLELLLDAGVPEIKERVFAHIDALAAALAGRGLAVASSMAPAERSGIVCFEHPNPEGLFAHCLQHGVALSLRSERIRLSPHFYADESDLERFIEVLDDF
ncbi:MAG: aminotransferase class V-fold PLP-dependent enzyme [Desulfovibrionaceae bacterium]|nr:aminotransferase class V-fold PLP-dependent enzyme [Desulfovibrionaceae bacterium]MBF0515065.1 aminotransferase class V-fold PLP-dependent enzyme [Desulfovibrionaceae bacterium]